MTHTLFRKPWTAPRAGPLVLSRVVSAAEVVVLRLKIELLAVPTSDWSLLAYRARRQQLQHHFNENWGAQHAKPSFLFFPTAYHYSKKRWFYAVLRCAAVSLPLVALFLKRVLSSFSFL